MIGQFPLIHLLKIDLEVETARDGIAWNLVISNNDKFSRKVGNFDL